MATAQKNIVFYQQSISADLVAHENRSLATLRTELAAVQKTIVPLQEYVSAHLGTPSKVDESSHEHHQVTSQVKSIVTQLDVLEKKIGTISHSVLQLSKQARGLSIEFSNQALLNKKTADFEEVMNHKVAKLERQVAYLIQEVDTFKVYMKSRFKANL